MLITKALILYDNTRILTDHAIYIEDSYIKEIGKTETLEAKYKDCIKIDARNKLVMPGLINSHTHLYSTFARGISLTSSPNESFLDILKNLWWKLDKQLTEEDIYYSALIPMIAAIKSGTTTLIDHHSSPNALKGSLFTLRKAYQDMGLRGATCYEVSDRDGEKVCVNAIDENLNFINECNKDNDSCVKGLFGMHAAFTLEDATLNEIQYYRNVDCGFHIHVNESIEDSDYNLERYKLTAVERLRKFGITGEKSIFAHCNHLTDSDIKIIAETGTNIIHNPQSNMNNGVGTADVIRYMNEGITVGLGSDGMSCGMFDDINLASLIHKHDKRNSNVGFHESYKLIMQNNPKIASKIMGYNIGKIKEGYKADIIIIDYVPPTPLNDDNFWSHFLFGIVPYRRIETTIVNGKILMENYELKNNIDEIQISRKASTLAKNLWERFPETYFF